MPFAIAGDGTRIHYEVTGLTKRAPVLLVQGLGGEKNSWNLQRAALALRHRTIAFDNRGAGRSDKPDGKYNLEEMADDAIAVLDAAGIENAHVVGLSMGGAISQIIALKHPNRVRSLTLVATACRNHAWREELLQSWATTAETEGMAAVGQFLTIGAHSFVAGGTLVRKNVPPFTKAAREPISYVGINSVGLRRRGFTEINIRQIEDIYRILFVRGLSTSNALAQIESEIPSSPIKDQILSFVKNSKEGIMKGIGRNV